MSITSEQAEHKYCPYADTYCVGKMCMKWEFETKSVKKVNTDFISPPKYKSTDKGYCNA